MNREKAKKKLQDSGSYASMQRIADWMDRFYVDAIVGMVTPYGIGDIIMALFSLVYLYFSLYILHSRWPSSTTRCATSPSDSFRSSSATCSTSSISRTARTCG